MIALFVLGIVLSSQKDNYIFLLISLFGPFIVYYFSLMALGVCELILNTDDILVKSKEINENLLKLKKELNKSEITIPNDFKSNDKVSFKSSYNSNNSWVCPKCGCVNNSTNLYCFNCSFKKNDNN